MGVAYNPRIVTDGLVACYDLGNVLRNTTTYTTTNFLQNGSFAGGLGVTYAFADGAGSNPTNTIVELENPGDSNYVLRQNGSGPLPPEYQMNIDSAGYGTLLSNTQYVMSGWYATSDDYNGGDTMFHARAHSSSGAHIATGTGIGTLLYSVEIGGLTWEYRYQTITTPSDHNGDFDWYLGYGTTNTTGYRYYTGLRVEEGSFPSLVDLSKNSTDATVFNGLSFTNSNGGYVTFDGTDDYIGIGATAGDLGIYDSDYTFEAWVYPTDISALSGDNFIFGNTQTSLRKGLHLGFRNTGIYQGHYSSDYSSGTVTANQWYHLAWTYEKNLGAINGTAKIYKNGQLQPNPGTINSWIGDTEILIGHALTGSRHLQGRGALFKIYNRALTSKEVLQNFDAQKVRYGTLDPEPTIVRDGLSLYYDASNNNSYIGYGNVVYDIGSGDYPGSLVGTSYDGDGYFDFDGADDYISSSAPLAAGQQKYTISAWWKTSVNNRTQVVWEQNSSTSQTNQRAALLLLSSGVWGLNGQSNDAHNKVPVRANQWTYGVITVDTTLGSNPIKIYENGSLYWEGDTSAGASNLNVGTSGGAGLGRKISNNNEYFIGNIGLVKIYDRVLTSAEVLQNYNALKGRYIDYKATVIEDSLLLYLDAANNDSYPDTGTTWTDLSGNGCNGTLQGGVGYSADNGGILTFDGVDDYVSLVDNFGNPQRFTIDFWCYPTALNVDSNNNYRRILTAEGVNVNFILIEQGGDISFRVPGGFVSNFTASGFTGANQWGHVVCTYDQVYKRIYFNGSLVSKKEEVGATVDFGTPQIVSPSNIQTFEGRIANFRIYDRALNAKEIEKNFNILRGRFGI